MKNSIYLFICILSINYSFSQVNTKAINLKPTVLDSRKSIYLNTIDPAVTSIYFKTLKFRTGDQLEVTGLVKNIGGKNYRSNTNQQNIQIWEIYSSDNKKLVQQMPFTNLNSNEEIKISYRRNAFKRSNEFPPQYQVIIVYDPDITIDNNINNDDAKLSNNSMTRSPE